MPIQLFPQLQAQGPDLSRVAEESARADYFRQRAGYEQLQMEKDRRVQEALQSGVGPGQAQLAPAPGGTEGSTVNLGPTSTVVDHDRIYNNLAKVDIKLADEYDKSVMEQKVHQTAVEEATKQHKLESFGQAVTLMKGGLHQEALGLLNTVMPQDNPATNIVPVGKDKYMIQTRNGQSETWDSKEIDKALTPGREKYVTERNIQMLSLRTSAQEALIDRRAKDRPTGLSQKKSYYEGLIDQNEREYEQGLKSKKDYEDQVGFLKTKLDQVMGTVAKDVSPNAPSKAKTIAPSPQEVLDTTTLLITALGEPGKKMMKEDAAGLNAAASAIASEAKQAVAKDKTGKLTLEQARMDVINEAKKPGGRLEIGKEGTFTTTPSKWTPAGATPATNAPEKLAPDIESWIDRQIKNGYSRDEAIAEGTQRGYIR